MVIIIFLTNCRPKTECTTAQTQGHKEEYSNLFKQRAVYHALIRTDLPQHLISVTVIRAFGEFLQSQYGGSRNKEYYPKIDGNKCDDRRQAHAGRHNISPGIAVDTALPSQIIEFYVCLLHTFFYPVWHNQRPKKPPILHSSFTAWSGRI